MKPPFDARKQDKDCLSDILWGLAQVDSTSEQRENQQKDLLFFEIVPVISAGPQKFKHKLRHNYFTFNIQKVRGIFLIIEIRVTFGINEILKIEIFWGHEVLKLHF